MLYRFLPSYALKYPSVKLVIVYMRQALRILFSSEPLVLLLNVYLKDAILLQVRKEENSGIYIVASVILVIASHERREHMYRHSHKCYTGTDLIR